MNQERLARINEMAREHQLGVLHLQCTLMTLKEWAMWTGGIMAFGFLILVVVGLLLGLLYGISFTEFLPILGGSPLLVLGAMSIIYIANYFPRSAHVYIYTHGLVYLNWHRSGVARWEEIGRVDLQYHGEDDPSTLDVYLNDGTRIRFPVWPSRGSADVYTLKQFIQGKHTALLRRRSFPEERFKEYLSLMLMEVFVELGKVNEEMKALPSYVLGSTLSHGGKRLVFIMALGDCKDGLLSLEDLIAIADYLLTEIAIADLLTEDHQEPDELLRSRGDLNKWEKDEFYSVLRLCTNLRNEQSHRNLHISSRETAMQTIMRFYRKNKSADWRDRRQIPENQR